MYGCTTLVADPVKACVWLDPVPLVTALFVTLWVRVALGPAVVPVATLPAGFDVVAVIPVVAEFVLNVAA